MSLFAHETLPYISARGRAQREEHAIDGAHVEREDEYRENGAADGKMSVEHDREKLVRVIEDAVELSRGRDRHSQQTDQNEVAHHVRDAGRSAHALWRAGHEHALKDVRSKEESKGPGQDVIDKYRRVGAVENQLLGHHLIELLNSQ